MRSYDNWKLSNPEDNRVKHEEEKELEDYDSFIADLKRETEKQKKTLNNKTMKKLIKNPSEMSPLEYLLIIAGIVLLLIALFA